MDVLNVVTGQLQEIFKPFTQKVEATQNTCTRVAKTARHIGIETLLQMLAQALMYQSMSDWTRHHYISAFPVFH